MYKNLQAYLADLERRGELVRVREPVSAELEITEIADRLVKREGPAVLFERVEGKDFPLAIGLYGTAPRTARALGVPHLDALAEKVAKLLDINPGKGGLKAVFSLLPKLGELKGFFPRRVLRAPVLSLITISEPKRRRGNSYARLVLKKKNNEK